MRKIVCTLICCMAAYIGLAQQPKGVWSLKQCVDYAMQNNINVKNNILMVDMADINLQQSKLNYIPSVSGQVSYNINTGRALDPTTYKYTDNQTVNNINAGLGVRTMLFAGMERYHTLRKAQQDLLATIQDVQRFKNDMSLSIAMYYLEILFNKELINTYQKQLDISQNNINRMQKLVAAGTATRGELLDMQAQHSNEEYSLVDGINKLAISKLNLCQILEIKADSTFDVEVPAIPDLGALFPIETVDQIFDLAQVLPEVEAPRIRVKMAEKDVQLAKAKYYPSLNFNFGYNSAFSDSRQLPIITDAGVQYQKYKFMSQLKDNAGTSISFGLSVPIFNSLNTRNGVRIAKINLQKAIYTEQNSQIELYKVVQTSYTDALGAMKKYEAALKRVTANQEAINYMQEKFSVGTATVVDYNVARNNLMIAQSQMLQSKYDYIFKIKVLDFYKGVPIELSLEN